MKRGESGSAKQCSQFWGPAKGHGPEKREKENDKKKTLSSSKVKKMEGKVIKRREM